MNYFTVRILNGIKTNPVLIKLSTVCWAKKPKVKAKRLQKIKEVVDIINLLPLIHLVF